MQASNPILQSQPSQPQWQAAHSQSHQGSNQGRGAKWLKNHLTSTGALRRISVITATGRSGMPIGGNHGGRGSSQGEGTKWLKSKHIKGQLGPRVGDVKFFNHGGQSGPSVGVVTFFNHVGQLGPCVRDLTFFNHVGQLGPYVGEVTLTHEKP